MVAPSLAKSQHGFSLLNSKQLTTKTTRTSVSNNRVTPREVRRVVRLDSANKSTSLSSKSIKATNTQAQSRSIPNRVEKNNTPSRSRPKPRPVPFNSYSNNRKEIANQKPKRVRPRPSPRPTKVRRNIATPKVNQTRAMENTQVLMYLMIGILFLVAYLFMGKPSNGNMLNVISDSTSSTGLEGFVEPFPPPFA